MGCGSEELAVVETATSGQYQVRLMAPGGVLKSGSNSIVIEVTRAGDPVEVQSASLMYSMPQMGSMPYMERHAEFGTTEGPIRAEGNLNFNMGGSWNGHLEVVTAEGPVTVSFQTHVEGSR